MRWHKSNIEPVLPEIDSHFIIKTLDNKYNLVSWNSHTKTFYTADALWHLSDINEWCYLEEDDTVTDEIFALNAIQDAVKHVQSLYDILLTDGICCGEEYRELVGLNELQTLKRKITQRILYLDEL